GQGGAQREVAAQCRADRARAFREATSRPRPIRAGQLRPACKRPSGGRPGRGAKGGAAGDARPTHTRLSEAVKERLRVSIEGEDFPVHLTLDEAEGITRVLWKSSVTWATTWARRGTSST